MSDTPINPIDMARNIELAETVIPHMAEVARIIFDSFLAAGFTREEALVLVRDWLNHMRTLKQKS